MIDSGSTAIDADHFLLVLAYIPLMIKLLKDSGRITLTTNDILS